MAWRLPDHGFARLSRRLNSPAVVLGILLGMAAVLCVAIVKDFGVSWDEAVHATYAEGVLRYFGSLGQDQSCNDVVNLKYYTPAVDLMAAAIYQLTGADKYQVRHLTSALLTLATLPALYWLGRTLGNRWLGIWAAAALLAIPAFVGHAFVNTKDAPFACAFAWALAALAAQFVKREVGWRDVLRTGLALGFALAIRPGSWLLLVGSFIAVTALSDLQQRWRGRRSPAASSGQLGRMLVMFGIAWLLMIAFWPWAQQNPLLHPLQAIRLSTSFHASYPVLFEGFAQPSDRLPWYYLAKYLLITLPPTLILFAGLGLVVGAWEAYRCPAGRRARVLLLLGLWTGAPILLWTIARPNIYDGIRHFLFVLPGLAMCHALGISWLLRGPRMRFCRTGAAVMLAAITLLPIGESVRLHPYQMTYFNELVGGLMGADGRYETDYWVTSYREAIEWINAQARHRPVHVLVAANSFSQDCAAHFAEQNVRLSYLFEPGQWGDLPPGVDYYLATYRYGLDRNFPDALQVHAVGRDGALFAIIKARRETVRSALAADICGQRRLDPHQTQQQRRQNPPNFLATNSAK